MKKVWSIYSPQGRLIEQQEKDTKILEKKDTKENASVGDTIKTALEANIEPLPEEIPFTLANYNKLFRRGVKTPIETVKMGEHQFEKFSEVNGGARKVLLAPAYQTLKDPAFIGKDENGAKLYCKEFSRENKKDKIIVSVVIDKDDSHISISNHIERLEQIQKKCRQGLYVKTTQNLDGNRREGPNNEGEVHDNDESVRQDDATHNSIIDNNTKMSSKKMDFPISYKDFLDNIDEATRKKIDNKVAKTDEENGWGISDEMGYELIDRGKVAIKDNDWATLYEIFSILEDCNFHPEAKAVLEGDFSVMEATLLSDNSYTIHVDNNGYTILEPPPQTEQEKHDNRSEAMLGNQNARKAFSMLSDILQGKKEIIAHKTLGDISIEAGETGKSGWGLKHIIEQRAIKDSRNADEIVAMIPFILDAVKDGKITRQNDRIYELEKDGFFAIIRKDMDGKKEKWVLTGFDDWKKEKEATDAIKTVIDTYGYTPEFSSFRNQVGAVIDSITQQKNNDNNNNLSYNKDTEDANDRDNTRRHQLPNNTTKIRSTGSKKNRDTNVPGTGLGSNTNTPILGASELGERPTDATSDTRGRGQESTQQRESESEAIGKETSDTLGRLSKKTAKEIRKQCLELLANKTDKQMTEEDKALLRQYEGAGGLNEGGQTTRAVLSEFYTPRDVIAKVWELVDKYNHNQNKTVIEPSSGIGRFAENRTEKFTLCEIDETSARIAGILHPKAEIKQGAFQNLFVKNNVPQKEYKGAKYDVAIGNPPYGDYNGLYKGLGEGKNHTRYEEYFIDRTLDTLKDGGIMAFVMPSGFLRGKESKAKEIIASKGKLQEAWRLPKGTFSSTDIGTDIVIIKKEKGDIKDFSNNAYFNKNENHVIGTETDGGNWGTKIIKCPDGKTIEQAIQMIDVNATSVEQEAKQIEGTVETKIDTSIIKKPTIIGTLKVGARFIKDGEEGSVTYITDTGAVGYKLNNGGMGRVTKADIEVTRTTKTALEIHENRSQAMLGNDNAKKAFHKEQQEKAKKGDIFQASIGKNMTADEFNTKYCGKKIPKEDLRYWQVMKYDNTIDTTKLSKNEIAELEKNKNFIKDENSNWTSTVMYASGNIYDKLEQLEDNKDNITQEEYKEKKAILEAVLPAKRKVGEFTITPTENIADDIICENGRPLNKEFLHWLNRNSVVEDELTSYDLTKQDIADFVRQRPVRTERGFDKETEKMRAQTKRAKRRDVAISLFNEFLAEDLDDETKKKLEDEYNKRYNAIVNPDYKKMPLFVEGMNTHKGDKEFNLTEQQIQGVTELCNRGTGILAYDVGVGKTVTGLIATVNQMQTGKSKRPLICVPKSVYKNWIASAKQHFPDVKINELGNFGDKFLDRYKDEQGKINLPENAINICTYQALEKITFNEATLNGDLRRDLLESQSAADYDRNGNRIEDTRTEKQIKAEIEKIETLLGVGAKAKEGAIDWEQFGFDNITVDEVHNFKNIFMIPRERNKSSLESDMTIDRYGNTVKEKEEQLANEYKGISGATSARGIKMFCISQLVQKKQNGRGFLGLSATPFNNSPVEIYNILSLVARDELKRQHIYNLQDFMKKFAELKNDWKVDAKGDVESVQVMKNFKCLPDLQALITRYIDKVDGEEAGVVRPYKRVHTPELDLTPLQKAIMQAEMARMDGEFTRANDSGADKAGANTGDVLVAMNNMRMATLSPTLIDPKFYADYRKYGITSMPNPKDIVKESPKLKFVCDCCTKQYKTRPTEGQVIYMPRGVKQFEYVKDYLVKQGIDASAVAFLRPGINDDKKEEIMNDFNNPEGKIKIIIGSETIKEGVNLNGNSTVLYNTMLGWNPTETTQVEGRIWRQGNRQGVTHIVYPLMNDSIDSMMYQKYDEKSSRLNDLWSYKGDSLNVEDIDPEEIKFELIKDPQKRADMKIKQQKAQVEADLRMLNVQYDKIVKWQSEAKSLQQSFEKEVSPDAWDDRITNMRSQVMLYSHMLAEIKKYAGKKEYKDKGISEIPQLKDKLDAISYGYGSNYYTVDETIQKYQQIIKDAQSYLNNKQKELQKLKENLSKQGCNDDTATDKKLNAISQKRQELNKQLDEIINNRENLIEQAKKDIARQQASQKHVSLENQIQNYSSAISGDLRDFSKVKSAIDLLKTYTPQQIQEVINTVRQQGSCKLGDDTLTEKELKDLQKYKDRAVIKKSLCFIYKGRLWVKNEAWGGVRYV